MIRSKLNGVLIAAVLLSLGIGVAVAKSRSDRSLRVLCTGNPFQVAFSPDGKRVALATMYSMKSPEHVEIWDVTSPTRFRGPKISRRSTFAVTNPLSICFSGDSKNLICTAYDQLLRWDVTSRKKLPKTGNIRGIAYHAQIWPNSDTLVFKSYGWVVQSDVKTGEERSSFWLNYPKDTQRAIAFSPNGQKATWFDFTNEQISLRDTKTGRANTLPRFFPRSTSDISYYVTTLTFSPDSRSLAIAWFIEDHQLNSSHPTLAYVTIWDLQNSKVLGTWTEADKEVNVHAFSPDSLTVAAARSDGNVSLREVRSGKLLRTFQTRGKKVSSVSFAPDGKTLAGCASDGALYLWQVK